MDNPTDTIKDPTYALDYEIYRQKAMEANLKEQLRPLQNLYSWKAPERVYDLKSRRWYTVIAAIAMFGIIYAALVQDYMLIVAIIALVMMLYTVNSVPPHVTSHQITNKGLYSFNTLFLWKNLLNFWVSKRGKHTLIHIDYRVKPKDIYYQHMIILQGESDLKKVVSYLVRNVDYLGESEIERNALSSLTDGAYQPLLSIIGDDPTIVTKDPNDSPLVLKNQK
jgi:hypothetical protein